MKSLNKLLLSSIGLLYLAGCQGPSKEEILADYRTSPEIIRAVNSGFIDTLALDQDLSKNRLQTIYDSTLQVAQIRNDFEDLTTSIIRLADRLADFKPELKNNIDKKVATWMYIDAGRFTNNSKGLKEYHDMLNNSQLARLDEDLAESLDRLKLFESYFNPNTPKFSIQKNAYSILKIKVNMSGYDAFEGEAWSSSETFDFPVCPLVYDSFKVGDELPKNFNVACHVEENEYFQNSEVDKITVVDKSQDIEYLIFDGNGLLESSEDDFNFYKSLIANQGVTWKASDLDSKIKRGRVYTADVPAPIMYMLDVLQ